MSIELILPREQILKLKQIHVLYETNYYYYYYYYYYLLLLLYNNNNKLIILIIIILRRRVSGTAVEASRRNPRVKVQ